MTLPRPSNYIPQAVSPPEPASSSVTWGPCGACCPIPHPGPAPPAKSKTVSLCPCPVALTQVIPPTASVGRAGVVGGAGKAPGPRQSLATHWLQTQANHVSSLSLQGCFLRQRQGCSRLWWRVVKDKGAQGESYLAHNTGAQSCPRRNTQLHSGGNCFGVLTKVNQFLSSPHSRVRIHPYTQSSQNRNTHTQ